jgi:phosphoglycolate phosphatase-like HAD superfamily hydrolase
VLTAVALGAAKNRGVLFAQVYIDSTLAKLKNSDESAFLETIREWFAKADRSSLRNYVSSFVGPVLDAQGFVRGELSGNIISLFEDRNHTKALSLGYVVDSMESLDQTVKGKNYAVSLIKELKKAGLRWGILTNGSSWRLYYTKEKALFETFFQIDLGQVLERQDKLEVGLFAQFFNAQAFLLDEEFKCSLDKFRQESEEATREIEEHLQSKMEDILGKICVLG